MPYSFAEESDIRRIIRSVLATERDLLNKPKRRGSWHMPGAVQVYAARVDDAGGIPALTGTTPGSGTVDVYEISGGTLTAIPAMAGITAYNSSSSVAADDAWVVITRDPYTGSWSIVQLETGSNVWQTRIGLTDGGMAARLGTQMYSATVSIWTGNGSGELTDTGTNLVAWNISQDQGIDSQEYVLLQWEPTGSIWIAHEVPNEGAGGGTQEVDVIIDVDYASGELRSTQQTLTVTDAGATSTNSIFQADTVTVLNDVDFVGNSFRETHQTLTVLDEGATATSEVFAAATAAVVVDVDYTDSAARFWQTKATMTLLAAGSNVTSTWESGDAC